MKLSNALPKTMLKAIPRKFALSDILVLWPLGIDTIEQIPKLSGTAPCMIIAENKHAMWIRQSSPALMILSEDNSVQPNVWL